NIAWGGRSLGTPKQIVDAWMHSSGHRANILNGRFRDLGIGFGSGSPTNRKVNAGIYTTDFGYRLLG
ncbi:MAG: CAP domain-containing protein, partial [Solirubrobacterales bacterium]